MRIHSSILAWRIPYTEESGGLQSMGSQRVGHNLETKQEQEAGRWRLDNISTQFYLILGWVAVFLRTYAYVPSQFQTVILLGHQWKA